LSIPPPYSPRSSFRTAAKGDGGEKGLRKKGSLLDYFYFALKLIEKLSHCNINRFNQVS